MRHHLTYWIIGLTLAGALLFLTIPKRPREMLGVVPPTELTQEERFLKFKDYKAKAEAGDRYAQFVLGRYYCLGGEVPPDLALSAYWFRKSAEQGYHEAYLALGMCYKAGDGVEKNHVYAAFWLTKAACTKEYHTAGWAQIELGQLYGQGGSGLSQHDFMESYAWFAIASRSEDSSIKQAADEQLKSLTRFFKAGREQEIEKAHERLEILERRLERMKIDDQLFVRLSAESSK
jgi:TPR repeat protein